MENLLTEFQQKLVFTSQNFERYLVKIIDFINRLIVIKGARGAGKTTLLLQLAKYYLRTNHCLYISLDHFYFYKNKLYELAKSFELMGGKHLLLDDVHKHPNWSKEIKLIYDNFPKLQVVFTSSLLQIFQSESALSRCAVTYHLKELTFREFIAFKTHIQLPRSYTFAEILENHTAIVHQLLQQIKFLPLFANYLKKDAYPYFIENKQTYSQKLLNTVNLIIETDINAVENVNYDNHLNFIN